MILQLVLHIIGALKMDEDEMTRVVITFTIKEVRKYTKKINKLII